MEFLKSSLAKIFPISCEITTTSFSNLLSPLAFHLLIVLNDLCRSDMTKDKMIMDLTETTSVLFWGGVIMGCLSVGILGFAAVRYLANETRIVFGFRQCFDSKSVYCLLPSVPGIDGN